VNKNDLKLGIETVFNNFINAIHQRADINKKRADGLVGRSDWQPYPKRDRHDLGSTKKTERQYDKNADAVKALFMDFCKKFSTAPDIEPDAKQYSKEDLMVSLLESQEEIFQMIDKEDLTETCVDWELPGWGESYKIRVRDFI
jgi:hypothetical protein